MEETVSTEEAKQQILLIAKRCAMLYQSFAKTLVEELGEERGLALIAKAVADYGKQCGLKVKHVVTEMGLSNSITNFQKAPDLPRFGWESTGAISETGELHVEISFCPLAEHWQEEGQADLGRYYCFVDQAKLAAYNPDLECVHAENMLDGDKKCRLLIRRRNPKEED